MQPGPYLNSDKTTFAYDSVHKRWPAIVDGIISDLKADAAELPSGPKRDEAVKLEKSFQKLIDEIKSDARLEPFGDADAHDKIYNEELAKLPSSQQSWWGAPWLLSECYLYRAAQRAVDSTEHWKKYDMFGRVKRSTFEKSADAVSTLAKRYMSLANQLEGIKSAATSESSEILKTLLKEVLDTSLWGNATDLSLLVTVSLEQLKKLQVAAEHRDKEAVLVNDFAAIERALTSIRGAGRVDIILDNSGFELYTDLVLSMFLLDTGIAEQVVLHGKAQPWFVSDVTRQDWLEFFGLIRDESRFPKEREAIDHLVERLLAYSSEGSLVFRDERFWTTPLPFWEINKNGRGGGADVWQTLRDSKLVLFKGDLNYRKLTNDLVWPRTTPFSTAVSTIDIHLASLRTVKADVCVGLAEGKEAAVQAEWAKTHPNDANDAWAWSGSYAVVSHFNPASTS